MKRLTGEPIDHYVAVGFNGFYDIVRAIGHIHVNLCHAVDDTYRHNIALGETGGSGFKMSAGPHDLNAVQALEFVRQRLNIPGLVTDDFGREVRQRYFLSAAFKWVLSAGVLLNPLKFRALIKAVDNAFTMSPEFSIQSFAAQMSDLSASNIAGHSIPTTPATIDGQDALQVNVPAVRRSIKKLFYGTSVPSTTGHTPTTSSPSIRLNMTRKAAITDGSGTPCTARVRPVCSAALMSASRSSLIECSTDAAFARHDSRRSSCETMVSSA